MTDEMRTGIGLDFHRLSPGESLVLGGAEFDYPKGTVAHSDGDVLVHAVCDAVLGAVGLGDIGEVFPDDDPAYKDVSSLKLLEEVTEMAASEGFRPINVDTTLILQSPGVNSRRKEIEENVERVLGAPVNLKATTTESMGFIGEEKGIGAQAIALLGKKESKRE
ncbi:MAG: 2-C-methyl-D-erythritol 2,4-cyclodiphosphate synthase [Candidatus Acetothermia bacterium]